MQNEQVAARGGGEDLTSWLSRLPGRQSRGTNWLRRLGYVGLGLGLTGMAATAWQKRRRAVGHRRGRLGGATVIVLGLGVLVAWRSLRRHGSSVRSFTRAITVNKPRNEVYAFWRDFANFPRFMAHIESVEVHGDGRSTWTAAGPAGTTVTWQACIVEEQPDERIVWQSTSGDVAHGGAVSFAVTPDGRGTEVRVELQYRPPLFGKLGVALAGLFGREPGQQIAGDLRRFKQVMETGEVLHSDASIHRGMHAARPAEAPEVDLLPG